MDIHDGRQDGRQTDPWDNISQWEHKNTFSRHHGDYKNVG